MSKNFDYEPNVLNAFVTLRNRDEGKNFALGGRRNQREDGILIDQDTDHIFSIELTKITNEKIEKRTAFLIKN